MLVMNRNGVVKANPNNHITDTIFAVMDVVHVRFRLSGLQIALNLSAVTAIMVIIETLREPCSRTGTSLPGNKWKM